jgi:hypothetical protein
MSTLTRRKVTSANSYLLFRSPEIRVVYPASVPTWMVIMGTSSLPEGCTRGAEAELRWRELGGAGPGPQAPQQLREPLLGPGVSPMHKPPCHDPPRILRTLLGDDIFRTKYP